MPTDAAYSPRWSEKLTAHHALQLATTQGVAGQFHVRSMCQERFAREGRVCGVGVVGGAARCPSLEAKMYGNKYVGDHASVRSTEFGSVRSSEVQMY